MFNMGPLEEYIRQHKDQQRKGSPKGHQYLNSESFLPLFLPPTSQPRARNRPFTSSRPLCFLFLPPTTSQCDNHRLVNTNRCLPLGLPSTNTFHPLVTPSAHTQSDTRFTRRATRSQSSMSVSVRLCVCVCAPPAQPKVST